MNHISEKREELCRCRIPEGRLVPVLVWTGEVDNGVPDDTDIAAAVIILREEGC